MLFDGIKLAELSDITNLTVASGSSFPSDPSLAELFYKTSSTVGLYVYDGSTWQLVDTSADTYTITGDVTGTIDGGTDVLTLATVNSNVGSFGSASSVPSVTVNAKGLVTAASESSIAIATSQVTSGTFADGRIAASNVTQHQAALTILESQITDGAILARVGGNETITGNWTFDNPVAGAEPSSGSHLVTKNYVDNIAAGVNIHAACETATTAALPAATYNNGSSGVGATLTANANGAIGTVGGYSGLAVGGRVLVKDQADAKQNGIYVVTALGDGSNPWVLTRAADNDGAPTNEVEAGDMTFVQEGTLAGTQWIQVAIGTGHNVSPAYDYVILGTDNVVFSQFAGAGTYVAGAGLTLTGTTFDVVGTAGRIVANVDSIDLATVGTAGTYKSVTTDAYGRVTAGTNPTTLAGFGITDAQPLDADLTAIAALSGSAGFLKKTAPDTWSIDSSTYITGNQTITVSGDASGSGTTAITLTLASTGVNPDTYHSVTVDAKGRVTAGSNPTTLAGYGITDAQALDADLTAIAALSGSAGFLTKTAPNTWAIDTNTYLTGNQNITISGDVSGSGTTTITATLATVNSNTGTFGTGSNIPQFTVNSKGLITAVTTAAVAITAGAVTDFTEAVQDVVGAFVANGGGITATYSDAGNSLTLGSTATALNTASAIVARDGSGNFAAGTMTGTATQANNINGGDVGYIAYQSAVDTTALLAPGTSGYVLTTQGAGLPPQWAAASGTSVPAPAFSAF
jgi:phage-related tail fiber protein